VQHSYEGCFLSFRWKDIQLVGVSQGPTEMTMMRLTCVALSMALMIGSARAGLPGVDSTVETIVARELASWPRERLQEGGTLSAQYLLDRRDQKLPYKLCHAQISRCCFEDQYFHRG
jgi:hypothetical protein